MSEDRPLAYIEQFRLESPPTVTYTEWHARVDECVDRVFADHWGIELVRGAAHSGYDYPYFIAHHNCGDPDGAVRQLEAKLESVRVTGLHMSWLEKVRYRARCLWARWRNA